MDSGTPADRPGDDAGVEAGIDADFDAGPDGATVCPSDRLVCDGACVDPASRSHCGGCGIACGPGQACVAVMGGGSGGTDGGVPLDAGPAGPAFACVVDCASMAGTTRCGSACVNLRTDTSHCGTCGTRCGLANAANACTDGMCAVQACFAGFANCDNALPNGCEVNTQTDPNHCGGCGNRCNLPNATASCASGACRIMACNTGFADCDQSAANGCEVNPRHQTSPTAPAAARCPSPWQGAQQPSATLGVCSLGPRTM